MANIAKQLYVFLNFNAVHVATGTRNHKHTKVIRNGKKSNKKIVTISCHERNLRSGQM